MDNWEKNLPGREKTQCKSPEVESVFREQARSHCGWSGMSKGVMRSEAVKVYVGLGVHDVILLCLRWKATGRVEQSRDMI